MKAQTPWMRTVPFFAIGAIALALTVKASAQIQTSSEEKAGGDATRQIKVEHAEVVAVEGRDLILKMEDGTMRHLSNVPESSRVTVDGREMGIHDLKPGMHLSKTVTTTTSPKIVVTTQTVTGKVWHVTPPNSVILTMENNENQQFKIPPGQQFMVNGKMTDAFGLKKGMKVSATKIVEEPITQVEQEVKMSGRMPPPPPAPPADMPILVVMAAPTPAPVAMAAAAPPELPKTAGDLPLMGLLGLVLMSGSLAVRVFRKVLA